MIISTRLCVLLIYGIVLTLIEGDHFNGGTLTYRVLSASGSNIVISVTQTYLYNYSEVYCNDTMIDKQFPRLVHNISSDTFNCSRHCNPTGEYFQSVPVTSFCTDYSESLDITVGQGIDYLQMTDGFYFHIVFMLRKRLNGEYNRPPVAKLIFPIYIPARILQEIYIPTIDIDDEDEVRCRFADDTDECGDVCYPASLPKGTELLSSCTLRMMGGKAGDWYGVTIMVEDFLDSISTEPLSSIPIQFLIHVQTENTCRPPHLSSPLAESGQCISVLVNEPVAISLTVENFCSNTTTIQDIATLSFSGIEKKPIVQNTTSIWFMPLTWTPAEQHIGSQVFCAAAIDRNNYQSNQYCITFTVTEESILPCPRDRHLLTTQFTTIDSTAMFSTTNDSTAEYVEYVISRNFKSILKTIFNILVTSRHNGLIVRNITTLSIGDLQETTMITTTSTQSSKELLEMVTDDVPLSITDDDESSTTLLLLLATSINNTSDTSEAFLTSSLDNSYTDPVIILPLPNPPSPWLWVSPLMAVVAACFIALCIWCYCCCKHRQKPPLTNPMIHQNQSIQSPKMPYKIYNVSENETAVNIKHSYTSRVTPTSQSESYLYGNRLTSSLDQQT